MTPGVLLNIGMPESSLAVRAFVIFVELFGVHGLWRVGPTPQPRGLIGPVMDVDISLLSKEVLCVGEFSCYGDILLML